MKRTDVTKVVFKGKTATSKQLKYNLEVEKTALTETASHTIGIHSHTFHTFKKYYRNSMTSVFSFSQLDTSKSSLKYLKENFGQHLLRNLPKLLHRTASYLNYPL